MTVEPSERARELEPCPFCGGSEEGFRLGKTGKPRLEELSAGGWRVNCYTCQISTWNGLSKEEAIQRWNTRLPAPPNRAGVEGDSCIHCGRGPKQHDMGTCPFCGCQNIVPPREEKE